ncbi:hypothetical protein [Pontibacter vulgaris]|uniref:hypothetical protein n=1 Tax=Pontibacter vulgaris TaxID=2905679 RepID=UPI001FA6EA49|nr:hypothetical protein [Pontibacter vulgaris]
MAAGKEAAIFRKLSLSSAKKSMAAQLLVWVLNLAWFGFNYFWQLVPAFVLVAVPALLLMYAILALAAYIYWALKEIREQDAAYANLFIGVVIAGTLLFLNYKFLHLALSVYQMQT